MQSHSRPIPFLRLLNSEKNFYAIATYRGLIIYDALKNKTEYYHISDGRKNTINNNHIYDLLQVDSSTLWLATNGGGINIFNIKSGTFRYIVQENEQQPGSGVVNNYCISLLKDHSGRIWIGTYNGLSMYDQETGQFKSFLPDQRVENSLVHNWIYCIFEDSNYNIWIGTYNGLNQYNPKKQNFRLIDKNNGLADNVINSIIEDNDKNLWISTGKGISKISIQDFSCKSYNKDDGLGILQFSRNAVYKDEKGIIYFGGKDGILAFNPEKISYNPFPPTVRITGVKLFNKLINSVTNPQILPQEIVCLKKIKIPYNQNVISFEFTAFNYLNSGNNKYEYKLEGFDKDWQNIENKHDVTYTNLNPGEYRLRIRAANNDGIWNLNGSWINVTILPPWWRTFVFQNNSCTINIWIVLCLLCI